MATPVDNFKNSLFGQLKSYSDAVQGAFEQRIGKFVCCVPDKKKTNIWFKCQHTLLSHEKSKFIKTDVFSIFNF
jgi:hypothetical protein